MVAGFNMLSFDLFGLGRKAQENKLERERGFPAETKKRNDQEQLDNDQEHELFFWSLYPVI